MSSNEGDAIASCSGAYYAGKKPVVFMQNSGLGNAVSPLTSLTNNYEIPLLGIISLRGEKGIKDEPQHELMGEITKDLLDLMKVNWEFLEQKDEEIEDLQNEIYQIAKGDDIEPKDFFKVLYQIILSTTRGPKIGPFILDIGKQNVAEKIGKYVK